MYHARLKACSEVDKVMLVIRKRKQWLRENGAGRPHRTLF